MKIVADENIPLLQRFFGDIGEVQEYPGREISTEHVRDADVLVVRSVTPVSAELLAGSRVRFVGSCTIGIDHVDTDYLQEAGITFAHAPGSNANSVVEYILSCLSILTETHNFDFDNHRVGIVGFGNVGSLLHRRLSKMGVSCLAYDPLLDDQEGLSSLKDVLDCEVITLHVPLTTEGEHATHYMFNAERLSQLRGDQVLINTCRGAVIDNAALKQRLQQDDGFSAILDVWENEPNIDPELMRRVFIGTPHIAGYSFDGKVAGTEMVYRALCSSMGLPARHKSAQFLEEPPLSKMAFTSMADVDWCIHTAIRACFDVRHDHSQLLVTMQKDSVGRAEAFDALRRDYRCRREFAGVKIQLKKVESELHSKFKALGFNVKN
ncbi:MAG: 4-phosphoerythronate dehydrogenase PdxB [Oleiphilaceae bacterium]|nr:4-phosphoerythronate dehydrogenase PdxB [Oleiphilaceae bacterium]